MTTPETSALDTVPGTAPYEIAIVGAGYVGVPLAQVFAEAGRRVVLVDIDARRVERLRRGDSYIEDVPSEKLAELVSDRRLGATTDYDVLREVDAILIALPTPLSKQREPDLSIVLEAGAVVARHQGGGARTAEVTVAGGPALALPTAGVVEALAAGLALAG